jgi:hypothetical protein
MKIKSLQNVLCIVILSVLSAQRTCHAEDPASAGTPTQTLFAYRSDLGARLHDSLSGFSVLPSDLPVELTPVDPSALAHATLNSTVTFRVANNVTDGHFGYGYAGTLIEAKVIRIREGELRIRHGRTESRVVEVAVTELIESSPPPRVWSLKLRLESFPRSRSNRIATQLITLPLTLPLKVIHIAVLIPEYALLGIACSTGGCDL